MSAAVWAADVGLFFAGQRSLLLANALPDELFR
jgi:hypothetical protein